MAKAGMKFDENIKNKLNEMIEHGVRDALMNKLIFDEIEFVKTLATAMRVARMDSTKSKSEHEMAIEMLVELKNQRNVRIAKMEEMEKEKDK